MRAPLTTKGAQRLRAELDELKSVKRPAVIAAIAEARAHGDLKENAEYHAAKEAQAHLETRILRLREKLLSAEVVEVQGGDEVGWKPEWTVESVRQDAGWYWWNGTSFAAPCAAAQAAVEASLGPPGLRPLDVLRGAVDPQHRDLSAAPTSAAAFRCTESEPTGSSSPE